MPKSMAQGVYANLENMIEFATDGIVSKTVFKAPDKEVSLFCMYTGQMLSSHTSSYPAIIHMLRGKGEITLAKKKYEATTKRLVLYACESASCIAFNRQLGFSAYSL